MKKLILILLTFMPFLTKAQVTLIPDPVLEQRLVSLGIDSDGVVNGQILTADAQNTTQLSLESGHGTLTDFTGLEAFINCEEIESYFNDIQTINLIPLRKLKKLHLTNSMLRSIDLSGNINLESLYIGNGLYVKFWNPNDIEFLDLSNNNNLKHINLYSLYGLRQINLKNHNAHSLNITLGNEQDFSYNICIEVDDAVAATNGTAPYDTWNVIDTQNGSHFFSVNCALSVEKFVTENFKIYPNPATEYVAIEQKETKDVTLQSVQILDSSGKWIKSVKDNFNKIDVSNLSKGMYLFVIQTDKGNKTEKIIIK
jgi:hypothetical protein